MWKRVAGVLTPANQNDTVNIPGSVIIANTLTAGAKGIGLADIASDVLTTQQMLNTLIGNLGQSAEKSIQCAPAGEGINCRVRVEVAGFALHFWGGAGVVITFDGVNLDAADKVSNLSPVVGDYLDIYAYKTGASAYRLALVSGIGAWIDGGQ